MAWLSLPTVVTKHVIVNIIRTVADEVNSCRSCTLPFRACEELIKLLHAWSLTLRLTNSQLLGRACIMLHARLIVNLLFCFR